MKKNHVWTLAILTILVAIGLLIYKSKEKDISDLPVDKSKIDAPTVQKYSKLANDYYIVTSNFSSELLGVLEIVTTNSATFKTDKQTNTDFQEFIESIDSLSAILKEYSDILEAYSAKNDFSKEDEFASAISKIHDLNVQIILDMNAKYHPFFDEIRKNLRDKGENRVITDFNSKLEPIVIFERKLEFFITEFSVINIELNKKRKK